MDKDTKALEIEAVRSGKQIAELQREIERLRNGIHKAWLEVINVDDGVADLLFDLLPHNLEGTNE